MTLHKGGCYCGTIEIGFYVDDTLSLVPRACDCDFCEKHGAEWVSAATGSLDITIKDKANLQLFKQGSETADLWICKNCGVVACVTYNTGDKLVGAVNRRALDDCSIFTSAQTISPKSLSTSEKKARWSELWIQKVQVNGVTP
ncbi:GFA family protein [Kordiimonas pumila]|uniref:GFA family protein n=1 Tax=Kordiimonas pumila TaxID=2161677 RepID=A0ABV7D8L1_9PROT|nr:aldehyde-activating protein [Kordiimonas pumila]